MLTGREHVWHTCASANAFHAYDRPLATPGPRAGRAFVMPEAVTMAKHNRITATYRINEHEYVQAIVDADNAYPEALAVASANTRQLVADILADVLELTRDPEPKSAES